MDSVHFAGNFTRTVAGSDGAVRTYCRTFSAFFAFVGIYMSFLVGIEGNRTEIAGFFASVSNTSAAGIGYGIATDRTLVTGDVKNFNDIGIVFVAAHCQLDSF